MLHSEVLGITKNPAFVIFNLGGLLQGKIGKVKLRYWGLQETWLLCAEILRRIAVRM